MIRVLGAAMVAGCGIWFGNHQAGRLVQRVQVLEMLKDSLGQLRRELELRRTPLPQLFQELSVNTSWPVNKLFSGCAAALEQGGPGGLPQIWTSSVEQIPCLEQEEQRILASLGYVLGRYPGTEQGQAIAAVCRELEQRVQAARAESGRLGKVYRAVGAAGGGFLIILLL